MRAQQISPRGGELACELRKDRVDIGGKAVRYLRGTITIGSWATSLPAGMRSSANRSSRFR